jgi:long-chain acyl-CoA synthetase
MFIADALKDDMPSVKKIIWVGEQNAPAVDSSPIEDILATYPTVLQEEVPLTGEDVASIMYTSGTTGFPKGALITHGGLIFANESKQKLVDLLPEDVVLCVLPLFFSGGLNDLALPCLYAGSTIVLRRQFSATEFWPLVAEHKVTGLYIVPTMWTILLYMPEASQVDTSSLRLAISGAAPIPEQELKECEERFGIPILEAYGLTECTGGCLANRLEKTKAGSVGSAMEGMEVTIFDEEDNQLPPGEVGEIVTRSKAVMKGYYKRPEESAETLRGGWLHTGDIGYRDEDGYFYIVDRKKEMIIKGGVNIFPKELENVIYNHPKVMKAAVIGMPEEKFGEVPAAVIMLQPGESATEEEILDFCRANMADYKVPSQVIFRDLIPTNPAGKVLKREIVKQIEEDEKGTGEEVPVAPLFEGMAGRFLPEKSGGFEAVISYDILGLGGGQWTVRIKDQEFKLEEGLAEDRDALLKARAGDYSNVTTGKIDGVTAVATGRMRIDGNVMLVAQLREMFKPT